MRNLLYTETRYKNNLDLLVSDSLLDYTIHILNKSRDNKLLAKSWIYKGKIWMELNEPHTALSYYNTALNILEDYPDHDLLAKLHNDVGILHLNQDLYEEALNEFREGYQHSIISNSTKDNFMLLRNIGKLFLILEIPDSTYHYFNKAFHYARQNKDSTQLINAINNDLSIFYKDLGQYEKASEHLQNIAQMEDKYYLSKGNLYYLTSKYDSAIYYLDIAEQSNDIYVKAVSFQNRYFIEEIRGDYRKANLYLNKYIEAFDSITAKNYISEIHAINHKHKTDKTIALIKNQVSARIMRLIILFLITLSIVITIYHIRDKRKKNKQNIQQQEILKKEKQISDLKFQISETRKDIWMLQHSKDYEIGNLQESINIKEKELQEMQYMIDELRLKLFKDNPIYKKVKKLTLQEENENIKILSLSEREELKKIVRHAYPDIINELKTRCPLLTEEDIFLCCLSKINLSQISISICTGYTQTNSVRQRKYRIKKKMTEDSNNSELYSSIFSS